MNCTARFICRSSVTRCADSLTLFDFADPSLVTSARSSTSGPTQALYLMNNPFIIRHAEAAADRLLAASGDDDGRIKTAYARFFARKPSESEKSQAREFLSRFREVSKKSENRDRAAWTAFCQALYAAAEFRYLD